MIDLKPAMLNALSALPACTAAAFAREEASLPVITVSQEGGEVTARADGEAYLEEYTMAVDVYAAAPEEAEALAIRADAALSALGLRRADTRDEYDEGAYAWRKTLRYRAVIHGDTLYQ